MPKTKKTYEPLDCFDGDARAAAKRMRRFAEIAIAKLPQDRLNLVSFTLAGQIEKELGQPELGGCYSQEISDELTAEREARLRRRGILIMRPARKR